MRFFVRMTERNTMDPQELSAMLIHRLNSITYQRNLLNDGSLAYVFRTVDGNVAILMYELNSLEALDKLLKRDPGWPYSETEVIPVISTEALVREAQEFLDIEIFKEEELHRLNFGRNQIKPDAEYWLAYKEVKPFSPLLSEADQNEVHRRTILAQEAHFAPIEFADDNPVGKAVGILVSEGTLEATQSQVEDCDVFPDTVVSYIELLPLERAWDVAMAELARLKRKISRPHRFTEQLSNHEGIAP